jgi:RNase P subunit RPR2
MRIIKEGKIPRIYEYVKRCTCAKCDTLFEFDNNDMFKSAFSGDCCVRCPLCNEINFNWTEELHKEV